MLNKISFKRIKNPLSLWGVIFSPSLRGAKQRSNLNPKGFSLIELMVAVAILAMAIFGIFHAYSVGFMGMADARDRTVATNYAREKMEDIKNKLFENIISDDNYIVILETKFKRKVTVASEVIEELKKVTTVVIWDDRNGIPKEVKLETLIYNND